MCSYGWHAAKGWMKKAILFDTDLFHIPAGGETASRLSALALQHAPVINGLQVFHRRTTFYVFYMLASPELSPGPYYHNVMQTWFIPVNDRLHNLQVPTRWAQDPLLISHTGILYYNASTVHPALAELIAQHTGLQAVRQIPAVSESDISFLQGGNLLAGESGNARFVLHHFSSFENRSKDFVKEVFGTDSENWIYCGNKKTGNGSALYHLDLFLTSCGDLPGTNRQLILMAEPYVLRKNRIVSAPRLKPRPIRHITGTDKKTKTEIVKVPLLLINENDPAGFRGGANDFVLSHNNCLVENFHGQETGAQIINLYFPDYCSEEKILFGSRDTTELINRFIIKSQSVIRARLQKKGITNIHFIRNNFSESARSRGSLRCLVKVVCRAE